jgi:hypothetical protein
VPLQRPLAPTGLPLVFTHVFRLVVVVCSCWPGLSCSPGVVVVVVHGLGPGCPVPEVLHSGAVWANAGTVVTAVVVHTIASEAANTNIVAIILDFIVMCIQCQISNQCVM